MKECMPDFVKGVLAALEALSVSLDPQEDLQALGTLTPEMTPEVTDLIMGLKKKSDDFIEGVLNTLKDHSFAQGLLGLIRIGVEEEAWTLGSVASFVSQNGQKDPIALIKGLKALSECLEVKIIADETPKEVATSKEPPQEGISKTALYLQGRKEYREVAEKEIRNYYWGGIDKKGKQHSALATANHLGISTPSLSKLMKEFGISKRTRTEAQLLQHKKHGTARRSETSLKLEEEEIWEIYWGGRDKKGKQYSVRKTAKKLGISYGKLYKFMEKHGIPRRPPKSCKKKAGDASQGQ